jgi:hypothetical protein
MNYHIIEVKYIGATNTKGSRVKMYSERFKTSKTIAFNYSFNSIDEMAIEYLKKNGFEVLGSGEIKGGIAIITSTFEAIK